MQHYWIKYYEGRPIEMTTRAMIAGLLRAFRAQGSEIRIERLPSGSRKVHVECVTMLIESDKLYDRWAAKLNREANAALV